MQATLFTSLLTATCLLLYHSATAQAIEKKDLGGIRQERRMDETTRIFDKATGKQISYQEYQQLLKTDLYGYHLEPIINEYGEPGAYTLRPTTADERETHRFYTRNPALRPKVGEPVPLFVMKGIDDKIYRSTDLKGHVVILSFWISLRKPFWSADRAKAFGDALRPYQSETDPITLGILQDSKQQIVDFMAAETLPFIAIPNAYGFHEKFHVTQGPTFIVIDRAGRVAAYVEGSDYDQLKKVLKTVSQ